MSVLPKGESIRFREVWEDNLEEEFLLIREIVDEYNYVAMDTEFPGVVIRPVGNFNNVRDFNYQSLKDNVDILKLIQVGLAFCDKNGNLPTCGTDAFCVWQFNFREFKLTEGISSTRSIDLLRQSGINFQNNSEKGIDVNRFGALLYSSAGLMSSDVQWVTFHSLYDFGYLIKVLTCKSLPDTQSSFFTFITTFFPVLYDVKHMIKFSDLRGGLNKVAKSLGVNRVGMSHQAGSDSLLTLGVFWKMKESIFNGSIEKYAGVVLIRRIMIR